MKPKDLKCPFKWEDRRPCLAERVLYVPLYYQAHSDWSFPGWESIFGRSAPLKIEYCSGNGDWINERAKNHPDCNWIAVEQRFDRVRKIWSKMKNYGVENLLIVCGEALTFTQHYVPTGSFDEIYINFPDPWPKGKHAKHRLIQDPFIAEMKRASKSSVKATIATDDEESVKRISKEFINAQQWVSAFEAPYFIADWPGYGTSFFDQLWRAKGKTIHYLQFMSAH